MAWLWISKGQKSDGGFGECAGSNFCLALDLVRGKGQTDVLITGCVVCAGVKSCMAVDLMREQGRASRSGCRCSCEELAVPLMTKV